MISFSPTEELKVTEEISRDLFSRVCNLEQSFVFPDYIDAQALLDELFPLCRSLTGKGYDQSLEIFSRYMPLNIEEYPSGSKIFDWVVPPRWELERAILRDSKGKVLLDADENALYVLNYSEPFTGRVSRQELESHLYSDATRPDLIPYVMSYYKPRWGFCLSHNQRQELLQDDFYDVEIVTRKVQGAVKVGVCELKGKSDRLVQFSSYLCHPNMINNELSGPIALLYLYHLLRAYPEREYTYRFVLNPETIGSLCYLSRHGDELKKRLEYGLVLTCLCSYYKNGRNKESIKPLDLRLLNRACEAQQEAVKVALEHGANVSAAKEQVDFYSLRSGLLSELRASINDNFLPIPLSIKLSHQSLLDVLHYRLENGPRSESDRLLGIVDGKCTEVKLSTGKERDASSPDLGNFYGESDVSFARGVYSTQRQLSDQERVALYVAHHNACASEEISAATFLQYPVESDNFIRFGYSSPIDNFFCKLVQAQPQDFILRAFSFSGSDERQYGSALMNLPVVQAARVSYGYFTEYHSSGDNQELFSLDSIIDSAMTLFYSAQLYERLKQHPKIQVVGEPQLGKRGLYPDLHSNVEDRKNLESNFLQKDLLMSLLSVCDGSFSVDELCAVLRCNPFELLLLLERLNYHKLVCYELNEKEKAAS